MNIFNWYPYKEVEWDGKIVDSGDTKECVMSRDGARYFGVVSPDGRGEYGLVVLDDENSILISCTTPRHYVDKILEEMNFVPFESENR